MLKHDNRRITIGKYPIVSLGDAREEAKRLLAEFTLGRLRPQSLRYQEAVRLFLADKAKSTRPRTVADYTRHLSKHFPFKGQLAEVTHAQVASRLDRLKNTPAEHNHARTVAMIFFNWCRNRRYLTDNPVVGISAFSQKRRSRILFDGELKQIWDACDHQSVMHFMQALAVSRHGATNSLDDAHFRLNISLQRVDLVGDLLVHRGRRGRNTVNQVGAFALGDFFNRTQLPRRRLLLRDRKQCRLIVVEPQFSDLLLGLRRQARDNL